MISKNNGSLLVVSRYDRQWLWGQMVLALVLILGAVAALLSVSVLSAVDIETGLALAAAVAPAA